MPMRAFLLLAQATAGAPATSTPPNIFVGVDAQGQCQTRWNGEDLSHDELLSRATAWPDKATPLRLQGDSSTPYRCVGGVVYTLQTAGFRRINFGQRRVELRVRPPCRITIDHHLTTWAELRIAAREWHDEQPDLHFAPDPRTPYRCVDHILKILVPAGVTKMGFIGNEALPGPNDPVAAPTPGAIPR